MIASPVVQQAYLGIGRRGAGMSAPLLRTARRAHAHRRVPHPARRGPRRCPTGQVTMLLGRNGAGKTTTLRTIMGLWQAVAGRAALRRPGASTGRGHARHRAALGIAYVPESMGIFTDLTVQENMVLAARAARRADELDTHAAGLDLRPVPGAEEVLALPGRQAVGRAEADAGGGARHRRAARAAADRRAEQGPGAVDHPQPDRRLPRAEGASSTTILLVEQNFQMARRWATAWR